MKKLDEAIRLLLEATAEMPNQELTVEILDTIAALRLVIAAGYKQQEDYRIN